MLGGLIAIRWDCGRGDWLVGQGGGLTYRWRVCNVGGWVRGWVGVWVGGCRTAVLPYSRTPYSRTPVLPYSRTPVLPYSYSYSRTPYSRTLVLSYSRTPVLPYSRTPVLLYSRTPVLLYSRTPVLPCPINMSWSEVLFYYLIFSSNTRAPISLASVSLRIAQLRTMLL